MRDLLRQPFGQRSNFDFTGHRNSQSQDSSGDSPGHAMPTMPSASAISHTGLSRNRSLYKTAKTSMEVGMVHQSTEACFKANTL